ncbi:peptidylprolyl isomerase [Acanthopleuribacter pedis]|uniref:Peptidylprolyl isomerase n=1 Tax=Acanthopleuribacter pedis TaxID=442870 RepID=A0A8J7U538_9BACT|nr:peptidylprolyl isomerase [Acanthopleuribacter pedis]MBO1322128.1 peptidylprolyl isomerase [Acanthopleuribacter pedis]
MFSPPSPFPEFFRRCLPALALLLLCLGCGSSEPASVMSAAAAENPEEPNATQPEVVTEPEPVVQPPDFYPARGDYAVSHILISHRTAEAAGKQLRTRQQAKLLSEELAVQLADDPTRFEELAKQHSDGPRAEEGGRLGSVYRGDLHPLLDTALANLAVGAIHGEPIETPFGYHFVRRDEPAGRHWGALHVFIPKIPDNEDKGLRLIKEINEQLLVDPLEKVAANYPNDLYGPRYTGSFTAEEMRLPARLIQTVRELDINGVSPAIELEQGWVYLKRIELAVRHGRHIVISHKDAALPLNQTERAREEARTLAEDLLEQLKNAPDNAALFAELARQHSDATTRDQGGTFGPMLNVDLYYAVDQALDKLNQNQIHETLIETPVGFQILRHADPTQEPQP